MGLSPSAYQLFSHSTPYSGLFISNGANVKQIRYIESKSTKGHGGHGGTRKLEEKL